MLQSPLPGYRTRALKSALPLALALLVGCQNLPVKKAVVDVPVPATFAYADLYGALSTGAMNLRKEDGVPDLVSPYWWYVLGSRELNRLVDRALANNPELRIATLQIVQAKVRSDQVHAGGLPTVTAPLRSAVQAPGGVIGNVPAAGTIGSAQASFQASLQGTWRADVWGEQSALNESTEMQLYRAVHAREDIQRNMIANVVAAYISYLTFNDALALARDNESVARDMLRTVEQRVAAQDGTLNELEQQRAALFVQQAVVPGLIQQRNESKNTLAQLLGTVPGALSLSDAGLDTITLPEIEPGLPATLLLRRPDIRMVEARMQAAHADIQVARARLLPPVDLSAQAGSSALTLAKLLQPQSLFWNTIASLAVTVFDGGRREGDKAFAQAYYEEMVETYGRTIYQAVREVDSALSGIRANRLRLQAQQAALRSALSLFKISSDAYELGSIDLTALLDSRRNYQRQLDDTQRVKADLLRSQVSLSQALGLGGTPDESEGRDRPVAADSAAGERAGRGCTYSDANFLRCLDEPSEMGHDIMLGDRAVAQEVTGWTVTLSGVFHRNAVLPLWRELRSRATDAQSAKWLHAALLGRVNNQGYAREAWYRLSVGGFGSQQAAVDYCGSLRTVQQNCNIAQASTPQTQQVSQRVSIARQNGP